MYILRNKSNWSMGKTQKYRDIIPEACIVSLIGTTNNTMLEFGTNFTKQSKCVLFPETVFNCCCNHPYIYYLITIIKTKFQSLVAYKWFVPSLFECWITQGSSWVWAQTTRGDVTLQRRLSLAEPIPGEIRCYTCSHESLSRCKT